MASIISGLETSKHNAKAFMRQFELEREIWLEKKENCAFADPVKRAFQYNRMIGLFLNYGQRNKAEALYDEACRERVWCPNTDPRICDAYHKLVRARLSGIMDDESSDPVDRKEQEYLCSNRRHEFCAVLPQRSARINAKTDASRHSGK